jgi:hypothetical protein
MPQGYTIMVTGLENSGRREIFDVVANDMGLRLFDFSSLMKAFLGAGERLEALSPARRRLIQLQAFTQYLSGLGNGYTVLLGRLMVQTPYGLIAGLVDMEVMIAQLEIPAWYIFVRDPMKIRELAIDLHRKTRLADFELNSKLIDFEQAAGIAAATEMCRKWSIPLRLVDMELSEREPGYDDFRRLLIEEVKFEVSRLLSEKV